MEGEESNGADMIPSVLFISHHVGRQTSRLECGVDDAARGAAEVTPYARRRW